ncbi:MAG: hypothetical protein ACYC7A_17550 [Thermoanaerobaculia bacterium]
MDEQFRPAPKKSATFGAWTAMLLIGFASGPAFVAAATAALVRSAGWDGATILYAPFAQPLWSFAHLFRAYPLALWIHRAPIIISVLALVLAAVLAWIVPARESAGGESFLLTMAHGLAVSAAAIIALDSNAWRDYYDDSLLPRAVIGAATALLIVALERRSVALFRSFRALDTAGSRLALWALRIPAGYAIFILVSLASGFRAGAIAGTVAAALTLVQTIASGAARERQIRVTDHAIGVSAAVASVVAVVLIGGMLVVFGHPLLGVPPRAVAFDGWMPSFETSADIDVRIRGRHDQLLHEKDEAEPIKIEWSRDRKARKNAQGQ